MYRYLLFDFDGTLVDTNEIIKHCLNEASVRFLERQLTETDYHAVLGLVIDEQMKYLSKEKYKKMVEYYRVLYNSLKLTMVAEFPGVHDMLKKLHQNGCKMAVISSKSLTGIQNGLEQFGMTEYFDAIVGAYDVTHPKPHPEPALKGLEYLNGKSCEALMIGDSPYDISCGKNAGIKSVLVDWTIFPDEKFYDVPPDIRIKTPGELIKLVQT